MLAIERMGEINHLLQKNGVVYVDDLAKRFSVSEMTVRRDLEKMEKSNQLTRCHGGAVLRMELSRDLAYDKRNSVNMNAKARIAAYCFEHYIKENSVIYLDAGSTVLELAKKMSDTKNLTVVTNDVLIAEALIKSNIHVFILGGSIQQDLGCIHGHTAELQLDNYRMDVAFVSSLCADDLFDVYAATENKVYFRKKLMCCASRTYMLMDESKFHRQSLFKINNLSDYQAVISDRKLTPEETERANSSGIQWITV